MRQAPLEAGMAPILEVLYTQALLNSEIGIDREVSGNRLRVASTTLWLYNCINCKTTDIFSVVCIMVARNFQEFKEKFVFYNLFTFNSLSVSQGKVSHKHARQTHIPDNLQYDKKKKISFFSFIHY